jgi:hypothetical protein
MAESQQGVVVGAPEVLADELREVEVTGVQARVVEEELGVVLTGKSDAGGELEQLVAEAATQLDDDRRASQGAAS